MRRVSHAGGRGSEARRSRSESKDEAQRLVNRPQLVRLQTPSRSPKALWIDDGGLFDENSSLVTADGDRRPEARRTRAGRGWGDKRGTEIEELVSLDDNRKA